jgi:hypothetical protein
VLMSHDHLRRNKERNKNRESLAVVKTMMRQ